MSKEFKCKRCGGVEYIIKVRKGEQIREACLCVKFKALMSYAPDIIKSAMSLTFEDRKKAFDITNKEQNIFLPIGSNVSEDIVNTYILYFLLKHRLPKFHVFNVYELLEIFFKCHPDFKTIFELDFDAYVFLEGYNEFANVRQSDIILQMFDLIKRKEKKILYISKKQKTDEDIVKYIELNNWCEIPMLEKSTYAQI